MWSLSICLSESGLFHLALCPLGSSTLLPTTGLPCCFYGWIIYMYIYIYTYTTSLSIHLSMNLDGSMFGGCGYCCNAHGRAAISSRHSSHFLWVSTSRSGIVGSYSRFCFCVFFSFFFLGPYLWHMEIPGLGVKSEPQLPANITVTAMPDRSCLQPTLQLVATPHP